MSQYVNPRAQACQNCVKAKAKCYGHNAGKCERCSRLSKECAMQAHVVRKRKIVKTTRQAQAERIAELEARLDKVVSGLSVSQSSSVGESNFGFIDYPLDVPTPASLPNSNSNDLGLGQGQDATLVSSSEKADRPGPIEDLHPADLLDIFRKYLARQAPFVLIPSHWSAETLSAEKPFLYQAVMAVSSYHDSVHQLALGQEFLRHLTEDLVIQGKRNLDMLQGLMIYVTWYNTLFHCASQVTTMLGLAFTMMIDLHLYIPSKKFDSHEKFLEEINGIVSCHQATWGRATEPSKEEKRVTLGCFFLFASVSANFCRVNPLHWTPYIQHCYDEILNNPENENDTYLTHITALQRISEDIKHSGIRGFPAQSRTWNAAVAVQFKLLMAELQRFKISLPPCLQEDAIMLMHYHAVEVYIYEIGFSMPPTSIAHTPTTVQRADALLLLLNATQSLADLYFSLDCKPYVSVRSATSTQMYFVMMTMSKLILFDAEDWTSTGLRTSLDLCALVERVAVLFEGFSALYDVREHEKPWLQVSQRMRLVKTRFERLLATENRWSSSMQPHMNISDGNFASVPPLFNQFDLLDDSFWQNFTDGAFMNP